MGACISHRECSSASLRCFRPCGQTLLAAAHADAVVDSALSHRLYRFAKSPGTRQQSASRHTSSKPLTGQPASFWAVGWCLVAMALGTHKGNNDWAWRPSPMGTQAVARACALVRVARRLRMRIACNSAPRCDIQRQELALRALRAQPVCVHAHVGMCARTLPMCLQSNVLQAHACGCCACRS